MQHSNLLNSEMVALWEQLLPKSRHFISFKRPNYAQAEETA